MDSNDVQRPEQSQLEIQKRKIRDVFDLFDKDRKGAVPQEEVGTIMRACGVYPTEKQWIMEMVGELQEDEEASTFVPYERLEGKILELQANHTCDPDTDETLLQAFRVLDTEQQGFITATRMKELLITHGVTPFREKEVDAFLAAARDLETGNIYYEDYIRVLVQALEVTSSPSHT